MSRAADLADRCLAHVLVMTGNRKEFELVGNVTRAWPAS
jgi:hypothetical protein